MDAVDNNRLYSLWLEWHLAGVDIGDIKRDILIKEGYLQSQHRPFKFKVEEHPIAAIGRDYSIKHTTELGADKYIDIVKVDVPSEEKTEILSAQEYIRKTADKNYTYSGKSGITRADWDLYPGEYLNYSDEFYDWINSINKGWEYKKEFQRFNYYKQQAQEWLSERIVFDPLSSQELQYNYLRIEVERCLTNSLYGANKFLFLKEGQLASGARKFDAYDAQALMLYLLDLKLNEIIAKLRQIGFSSVVLGSAMMRTMLSPSYFTKFVTEKGKKGTEIFDDKAKFAIDNFPEYLVPTVLHERESGMIRFGLKIEKGRRGGANSKFEVEAPYDTVINGGSPDWILIDEIGNIANIGTIVDQGRPTLFWVNPRTGKVEMKRQLTMWGSGGDMLKASYAMEALMNQAMEAWRDRYFNFGLVPLFFSYRAKPGLTKDFYDKEKEVAYRKKGTEGKKSRIIFHQTYPITLSDVFLVGLDTLLSHDEIHESLQRINTNTKFKPEKGYFQPIYTTNIKTHKQVIVGAEFVPLSDTEILRNPDKVIVTIYERPKRNWINRYYNGTDPILNVSGHSKMASAIWDCVTGSVAAEVNYRDRDIKDVYRQALLLNLYYGRNPYEGIPMLLEANIGQAYINFLDEEGYHQLLVTNAMLYPGLQTSSVEFGIYKTRNTKLLVNNMEEMLLQYHKNFWSDELFYQVKTFVKKVTANGNEKFEPHDKKTQYDDLLDAYLYAYLNWKSHSHLAPRMLESENTTPYKKVRKFVYDENFNVRLMVKQVPV